MISDPYQLARSFGCDDKTATQVATILNNTPDSAWRGLWLDRLNDSWWLERCGPDYLADYLNPVNLESIIDGRRRAADPFDPETIHFRMVMDAWGSSGGELRSVEIATGKEEVWRDARPGPPDSGATFN